MNMRSKRVYANFIHRALCGTGGRRSAAWRVLVPRLEERGERWGGGGGGGRVGVGRGGAGGSVLRMLTVKAMGLTCKVPAV